MKAILLLVLLGAFDGLCPMCVRDGQKSSVINDGKSESTIEDVEWWDEAGRAHTCLRKAKTHRYHCTKGHAWTEEQKDKPCDPKPPDSARVGAVISLNSIHVGQLK